MCALGDGIAESQSARDLTVRRVPTNSQRAQPALSLAGDSRGVSVFLWEHETLRPCQCVRQQSCERFASGGAEAADCSARGSLQRIHHPWGSKSILGAPQRQGSRSHEPGGGSQPEAQGVGLAGGGPRGAVPHLPGPHRGHRPRSALQAHLLQGVHPAVDGQQPQLPPVPPEDLWQAAP